MKTLIIKYLNDDLTEEEFAKLKKWIEDGNEVDFKQLVRDNRILDSMLKDFRNEEGYGEILKKIKQNKKGRVKHLRLQILKYAAVFLLFVISGYFIHLKLKNSDSNEHKFVDNPQVILNMGDGTQKALSDVDDTFIISHGQKVIQNKDRLEYVDDSISTLIFQHELVVPYGKRFSIELADGSIVHLNSGSVLKYPSSFGENQNREVYLEGEAFFEVAKNIHKPFIVKTSQLNVRVLGTRFNVSSYVEDGYTSATLAEGSVAVYPSDGDMDSIRRKIKPGEQARFRDGILNVKYVDVNKNIAWMKGSLYFDNERFEAISKRLERRFNTDIVNTYEALNDVHYTGAFSDEDLTDILDVFKSNTDFEYSFKDGKIVIEKSSL
ncbi:MAG: hypothetical protein CL868_16745 [Cytophagaceae bacterium]|nr:hypothetical protein [Cytophagaceae bacterium]|tara:strand:- start:3780 stop:4916 length:1137 start_codon:yes stop_codon:yes gene_type:complete